MNTTTEAIAKNLNEFLQENLFENIDDVTGKFYSTFIGSPENPIIWNDYSAWGFVNVAKDETVFTFQHPTLGKIEASAKFSSETNS